MKRIVLLIAFVICSLTFVSEISCMTVKAEEEISYIGVI